jgi:hypothetical protein
VEILPHGAAPQRHRLSSNTRAHSADTSPGARRSKYARPTERLYSLPVRFASIVCLLVCNCLPRTATGLVADPDPGSTTAARMTLITLLHDYQHRYMSPRPDTFLAPFTPHAKFLTRHTCPAVTGVDDMAHNVQTPPPRRIQTAYAAKAIDIKLRLAPIIV